MSTARPRPTFRPAPGLANAHVQTIAGKLLRPRLRLPLRRERIATPDGDFLDLDFVGGSGRAPGRSAGDAAAGDAAAGEAPLVLVMHGLEGSARRSYMRTTYRALLARGLRPVGLNFRGCSGEPNRTPRAYHSGDSADVRRVLEWLRARFAGPFGVVGYSLSGNLLLKLLGESGDDVRPLIAAAAAVSVPFDLAAGSDRIARGLMGRVYTTYFLRSLRRKMVEKAAILDGTCDLEAIRHARTLREFDDRATAPLHGFRDAADYYARASAAGYLDGIRVPTLVIHAEDDPFLPADRIPRARLEANPAITALITERGGHLGFLAGRPWRPALWAETVLSDYLAERLGARADGNRAGRAVGP